MGFVSKLTVSAVGLFSKAILNSGFCASVSVQGLDNLVKALEDPERDNGRGVITVANHISTMDEPVVWGVLPTRYYRDPRMTRWTLGASDVMFTNPFFSKFFRNGQVIETFRGWGIFQHAIDDSIAKLNKGEWIHLFSEGKVNPESCDVNSPNVGKLLRFKWGIGRLMMEAQRSPTIIPIWLTGFDKLMPEGRPSPYKYLPRPGADLSITFGEPVPAKDIQSTLATLVHDKHIPAAPHSSLEGQSDPSRQLEEERSGVVAERGWLGDSVSPALYGHEQAEMAAEVARVRSAATAVIQRDVEDLGRRVLGLCR